MVSRLEVEERIRVALECPQLTVEDISCGCGSSFNVMCVSPHFQGKTLLQRHRIVNALFAEELRGAIHAFRLKTYTADEYSSLIDSAL